MEIIHLSSALIGYNYKHWHKHTHFIITSFVSIQLQLVAGSKSDTTDIFGLVCPVCGNQSQACPGEKATNEVYSVVSSSLCTTPTPSSGNMLSTGCLLWLLCAEKLAETLLIWQPWTIFRKQNLENVKSLWCKCTLGFILRDRLAEQWRTFSLSARFTDFTSSL